MVRKKGIVYAAFGKHSGSVFRIRILQCEVPGCENESRGTDVEDTYYFNIRDD